MVKKILLFNILVSMFNFAGFAQNPKISFCVDSILQNLDIKSSYNQIGIEEVVKNYPFNKNDKNINAWNGIVEKDSIKCYEMKNNTSSCFILYAKMWGATGLGINFYTYLVLWPEANLTFKFESLSRDVRMIYFDTDKQMLQLILFSYSDSFFEERTEESLGYKLTLKEIDINGNINTLKIQDYKCSN